MVAFGVCMFPTDKAIDPMELARETEARGFESLWFPEHSHIPTSRKSPWGLRKDAPPLPEEYWRTHEQFVALGMAAAVTKRLMLGTGITLVAQRDPIWLAKSVATVDALSKGRLLFGIGYGWNREELEHHDVKFGERRAVLRERILAMKELWTNDEAEFHGEHVSFDASWQWPKPHQKPHPPVILGGGAGPKTMEHIVEFCDGFMPIGSRYDSSAQFEQIRQLATDKGRDPATIEFGEFGVRPKPEDIEASIKAGCARIVLFIPPADRETVLPILDKHTELVAEFA